MKNGISKESARVIPSFVNFVFFIFQKQKKQENCGGNSKICNYTSLIFENQNKQNNCARSFKICKYSFFPHFKRE